VDLELHVKEQVEAAVDAYKLGEEVGWAVTLGWTPANGGNLTFAWNIVLVMRGILLGHMLQQIEVIPYPIPTEEIINQRVMAGLKELRDQKAKQAVVGNGDLR
jgi:hypothetical protein